MSWPRPASSLGRGRPTTTERTTNTTNTVESSGAIRPSAWHGCRGWYLSAAKVNVAYYFFLSYSRRDGKDQLVRRFFDDLSREVEARAGVPFEEAGFLDVDQSTGTEWPATTAEAVGTCRVFVPLYSPSYFASEICGQEWHLFQRRLDAHQRATGESLARILPVWFVPPLRQPPVTERLHDTRDRFDADYRRYGLRYYLNLRDNESRYQDFLARFTEELVAAGDPAPPQFTGVNLLAEPNAFMVDATSLPAPVVAKSGPKRVTFVVATGTSAEMAAVREVLEAYGDSWDDWRPYQPDCPDPILLRAQGVAHTQSMISGPRPADEGLMNLLDTAKTNHEAVVLVLDPWVLGLDTYFRLLQRLDERRYGNVAILVPGAQTDVPVLTTGLSVRELLQACLGNWMEGEPRDFRQHLHTMEEFEDVLAQVLVEIRARIVNRAVANRRVAGGRSTRPILTGPEG